MKVARVIRNRDHHARAKSGNLIGFSHKVPNHSPAVIRGGLTLRCWSGSTNAYMTMAAIAKIDGTTNKITSCWANSWARYVPPRMPTFWAIPSSADTLPRWNFGTWSEMVAMNGARVAFAPSCARHHPTVTTGTVVAVAITTNAIVITTVPETIHGRRRPHRAVVRSDSRPNKTLPITANNAPNPATVASAGAFSASGTIDWTFTPIPMIAGPRSATKKTNWAKTRVQTYLGPTSLVGAWNQWCSCGSFTSSAAAAPSVGGRSPYGLPGVLLIKILPHCRTTPS